MSPSWQRCEVTLAPSAEPGDALLAAEFGVPVAPVHDEQAWQLVRQEAGLALQAPLAGGGLLLHLDLASGPLARRLRSARRDEPLARAVGLPRRATPPSVVDATAGLGRDALVLAQLGCQVLALERQPALALLLAAALHDSPLRTRLQVRCVDAVAWLAACPPAAAPAVVCLDPMFPTTGTAQVKKEMQVCRALAGGATGSADGEADAELLRAARRLARERVVVKRHPHAPPLAERPSFQVAGKRVRFDVYLTGGSATAV
ncbi:MAG: class I SAM-dependent methyltransferase [Planctomycetes bacterium]|nr:class I SAM-dependent methyltransferase [Planctomycetota bacterium]